MILKRKKLTLSVCESCTGGMLGGFITQISGSSEYFLGGIIAYSNEVKKGIIGVQKEALKNYGAVSAEVVREMAQGVRKKFKADIGIGITGIAGPGGASKDKPVGFVYIAIAKKGQVKTERFLFKGDRQVVRRKACEKALLLLKNYV